MTKNSIRSLALVAAIMMMGTLVSGCGTTSDFPDRPVSSPMPTPPEDYSQPQQESSDLAEPAAKNKQQTKRAPMKERTYDGQLPYSIPVQDPSKRVNALGEPNYITTEEALKASKWNEKPIRRAIARTVRLCYKVSVQQWALEQAQLQADWTKKAQEITRQKIKTGEKINYGLAGASAVTGFAVAPSTWLYGVLNLFGAAQSAESNHMWSLAMDQNDRLIDLNLILVQIFLGNEDLYLDSMQVYCARFNPWIATHGKIVSDDSAPNSDTPFN